MIAKQRTILIVDDTPLDREAYRQYLQADQHFAYVVLEEESAEEALALCRSQPVDGILLDFLLPDRNGLEFLTELQAQTGRDYPPVVMLASQGSESAAVQAIKSGAEDYLVKRQITPDRLRLAIRTAIDNAELRRQLQHSEERFRTSIDNMLDCFGIFSAIRDSSQHIIDFQIDYLNTAALNSIHFSAEAVHQRLCEQLPNYRNSGLFDECCHVVQTGHPLIRESFAYCDRPEDPESERFYDVRASKLNDGFVASWRDVTARHQAEANLKKSEERLRVALEAAQMGTWDWNIQTNEITWSANLERLFGFEEGGFDGQYETFVRLLHPDDAERVLLAIACAVNDGKPYEIEFRVVFPDGRIRWAESKGQVFYDETGRPVRMAGVDLDITARKQAEATLQQSEALFRGVFESDLIGILFWNASGHITDANDAFCQMTGYSREALQAGAITYHDITPAEYQALDAQKFETLQTTGTYEPIEKEYICKDGSRIPILLGCTFLPGYDDRGVAFVLDIRERKRLEQERETLLTQTQAAREEAELANRMKDEFLTVVSHELRSPLNAILGWSRLLQTRDLDAAMRERALSTIERNTQAQVQLIDDLLDISRMVRGSLRIEAVSVNLAAVVEMTIASLRLSAEAKQINLISNLDLRVGQVFGDANRLQQVVSNLLTNAIKFTPSGGQVAVTLQALERGKIDPSIISQLSPASCCSCFAEITITDTGKGISPDFLPQVFDRFRQADSSTTRSKDGLGLGLAIVRHLVELHGGMVTASSAGEGQGATFTVTLPLLQEGMNTGETDAEISLPTMSGLPLQDAQILVVDDELDTREFYKVALEAQGAMVTTAASAQDAFAQLQTHLPNVLVSDIGMPGEDGYWLIERIRQLKPDRLQQMPVIAVTAYARAEDRDRISKAGFHHYLIKPVEPQTLVTAIADLLQR